MALRGIETPELEMDLSEIEPKKPKTHNESKKILNNSGSSENPIFDYLGISQIEV